MCANHNDLLHASISAQSSPHRVIHNLVAFGVIMEGYLANLAFDMDDEAAESQEASGVQKKPASLVDSPEEAEESEEGQDAPEEAEANQVKKRPASTIVAKKPAKKPSPEKTEKAHQVKKRPASTIVDDDDDDGSELRDRLKSRKFLNMWDDIPSAIRDAYSEAKKKKDGTARAETTRIVNAYISRDSNGKMVANPDHPLFVEIEKRKRSKYMDKAVNGNLGCNYYAHDKKC